MNQPLSFLIIGAQKCGTTALSYYLSQHPQICLAKPKEAHLFDSKAFAPTWDKEKINQLYAPSFEHCLPGQICGEATPIYLYLPQIAKRIYNYNPDIKLIVLLRDPIERALSHYRMERILGNESWPLLRAFLFEWYRLRKNKLDMNIAQKRFSYLDRGLYFQQLQNLYKYFKPEQVLVLSAENLWQHHSETLSKVYSFLDVDKSVVLPNREMVFSNEQGIHSKQQLWLASHLPISKKMISSKKDIHLKLPFWLVRYYHWKYRKEYSVLKTLNTK